MELLYQQTYTNKVSRALRTVSITIQCTVRRGRREGGRPSRILKARVYGAD